MRRDRTNGRKRIALSHCRDLRGGRLFRREERVEAQVRKGGSVGDERAVGLDGGRRALLRREKCLLTLSVPRRITKEAGQLALLRRTVSIVSSLTFCIGGIATLFPFGDLRASACADEIGPADALVGDEPLQVRTTVSGGPFLKFTGRTVPMILCSESGERSDSVLMPCGVKMAPPCDERRFLRLAKVALVLARLSTTLSEATGGRVGPSGDGRGVKLCKVRRAGSEDRRGALPLRGDCDSVDSVVDGVGDGDRCVDGLRSVLVEEAASGVAELSLLADDGEVG